MLKTRVIKLRVTEGPRLRLVEVKTKMALYVSDKWGAYVITTWRLIADVTKTGNRV